MTVKTGYVIAIVAVIGAIVYALTRRPVAKPTQTPNTNNDNLYSTISKGFDFVGGLVKMVPPASANRTTPGVASGAAYDVGYNPGLRYAGSYAGDNESGTGISDGGT